MSENAAAEEIWAALRRMRMPGPASRGGPHGHRGPHPHLDGNPGRRPPFGPPGFGGRGAALPRLLEEVATAARPMSVSELADRIGVDQPRASRLVQAAVAAGAVHREADPDDARRTIVVLTAQGRAVVDRIRGDRLGVLEEALTVLDDAERRQLAALLTRVADAWPRR